MKSNNERVREFLRQHPKARERKFKDEAIVHMLVERYSFQEGVPARYLKGFVQDYTSYDREWRQILHDTPTLRGADYGDGERIEQEKMIDLGYEVGHGSNVKSLGKIK